MLNWPLTPWPSTCRSKSMVLPLACRSSSMAVVSFLGLLSFQSRGRLSLTPLVLCFSFFARLVAVAHLDDAPSVLKLEEILLMISALRARCHRRCKRSEKIRIDRSTKTGQAVTSTIFRPSSTISRGSTTFKSRCIHVSEKGVRYSKSARYTKKRSFTALGSAQMIQEVSRSGRS